MNEDTLKTKICDALAAWIRQRPGLDPRDYGENGSGYRSEARRIARDKNDAETLLQAVRWRDNISADDLLKASKEAFSGRLTITIEKTQYTAKTCPGKPCGADCDHVGEPVNVKLDYCTGQYWPTEYRAAVAAICARAIWEWQRASMPKPNGVKKLTRGKGTDWEYQADFETVDGIPAGDWLRKKFRDEFGSKLQRRWLD